MLQRAASNAYSWWWASHVRTKQSKWLEQNLQDMEEKVQNVLKLIEEDGDSFAKRAEMYYKKRPELIVFVEDTYRAYRALAERYDHLSTELQNANNTIASVFPEKVQFAMEEEYDFSPKGLPAGPESMRLNAPKVPKAPPKDFKILLGSSTRKLEDSKKQGRKSAVIPGPSLKSGLSKDQALERIDMMQKEILALQTEKEFTKSSYEGGLARYWEMENRITVMQAEVSALQDEFGEGIVIDDEEARRLMSEAALRSCQETLSHLEEKHRKSAKEASLEKERTRNSFRRLKSLKEEILPGQSEGEAIELSADTEVSSRKDGGVREEEQESALVEEKIKQHVEAEFSDTCITASKLTERIDELAEKVIGLETALASQAALMERLRTENNHLQAQIQALEDDKGSLIEPAGTKAHDKVKEMEEKLQGIHELNKSVDDQNNNLQTYFAEARYNLEHLSEKLSCIKSDEEEIVSTPAAQAAAFSTEFCVQPATGPENKKQHPDDMSGISPKEQKKHGDFDKETEASGEFQSYCLTSSQQNPDSMSGKSPRGPENGALDKETGDSSGSPENGAASSEVPLTQDSSLALDKEDHFSLNDNGEIGKEQLTGELTRFECSTCHSQKKQDPDVPWKTDDPSLVKERGNGIVQEEPNWRELYLKGMDNREKTLLTEYTMVLRNYKEMKKKFGEMEKKDEEILSLRHKVSLLQTVLDESKDSKELDALDAAKFLDIQLPDFLGHLVDKGDPTSEIELKLRMDIDGLLEENLEFWLRFSSALHQIEKYKNAVEDLQAEARKLKEKEKNREGSQSCNTGTSFQSEVRPIYKHLKDIQIELTVWSDKCMHLKDEQQSRFSSLCHIQEEITKALKASAEDDDFKFTSYQAAKFQGEVLNMKQENNKVANELQAGLNHIASLQVEVGRTLAKLNEKLGLPGSKNYQNAQLKQAISRTRIPLRAFIFGTKQKKQTAPIYMSPIPQQSTEAGQSVETSQWH
ncbi:hypothetical protein MLD38_005019 [Melastoma candidum]|uniref:Uncharacterized protein n=1 Tax=Melastoma candidum TaxID=119954 RepID=A0ACB9SBG0_9MYRT|nr:hypothetical protein MLD38_005019 [Melastoma candidum]